MAASHSRSRRSRRGGGRRHRVDRDRLDLAGLGNLVTARTKGERRDKTGVGVFLVPANSKGITKKAYPTQDGLHAADITFTGVEVGADAAIGDPENGLALVERVVDDKMLAVALIAFAIAPLLRYH